MTVKTFVKYKFSSLTPTVSRQIHVRLLDSLKKIDRRNDWLLELLAMCLESTEAAVLKSLSLAGVAILGLAD
jgi:hypothetical protein